MRTKQTDTPSDSLTLAKSYFESLERRDAATIAALFANDVVESVPFSATGDPAPWNVFDGKEQVMGYVNVILQNFSRIRFIDPVYTVSADGRVVFFEGKGDLVRAQGGTPYHNVYIVKVTLRDAHIVELVEYANPVTFAKLMGLPLG